MAEYVYDAINLNPVPAIASAVTGVAMALSWTANKIQELWDIIAN